MSSQEREQLCQQLSDAVLYGVEQKAVEAAKAFLAHGFDAMVGLHQGLIHGMDRVTERWVNGDYFLPDVVMAANAMQAGSEILHAAMVNSVATKQHKATVVLGTIEGDIHNIGKNLVRAILTAAHYRVIDIGEDQPPQQFIEAAITNNAEIVGISCILTTSLPYVEEAIRLAEKHKLRPRVKIIVGGVAVTQAFADSINADGYCAFGVDASKLLDRLLDVGGSS